jgi:hypothetical protein
LSGYFDTIISFYCKLGYEVVEAAFYLAFWQRTHSLIRDISILVKIDGWDSLDSVLRSGAGRIIYIHPGKFDSSRIGVCQFVQNRVELLAVPSPGGRKINQNGSGKLDDLRLEVPVSDVDGAVRIKAGQRKIDLAFCAHRLPAPSILRNSILSPAFGTPYYNRLVAHMCPSSL